MPDRPAPTDPPTLTALTLPALPLASGVVLPQMVVTIALETEEARAAAAAVGDDRRLLLVPNPDGRYAAVGVIAHVEDDGALPNGTPALVVRAERRARLGTGVVGTGRALWLRAEPIDEPAPTERARELAAEYKATARTLLQHLGGRRLAGLLRDLDDPSALADSAGWWPELSDERKVELLETIDVEDRLTTVIAWAREALAEAELAEKIRADVANGMERQQREFLLRQQLQAIHKELGEGDDDDLALRYREALTDREVPEAVRTAIDREIDRLERTSPQNAEHGWIRAWLDTVTEIPWGVRTDDDLDLAHARAVLDEDHTGLDEVKERIVEELAVRKLRAERDADRPGSDRPGSDRPGSDRGDPDAAGDARPASRPSPTIVVLVGPPGVGKTSLGTSVARALGRRFVRVALGGVRDEAEVRGHRRTYVGAREGRIAKALIEAGTMNPVLLLDEIDKVGNDWRGDPSAALLEVLDPAQNHTFRDHYLEVDLDLSEVLFLATANVLDTIPGPLLDRMEVIRIDGYTDAEKVGIARDHLLPRLRERMGLRDDEVVVTDEALAVLAAEHTREAGVRNLERLLGKVLRRTAAAVAGRADDDAEPVVVGPDDLPAAAGRPRFRHDEANRQPAIGVVNGLAVTGAGGDVLVVEATAMDGTGPEAGGLVLTGQLGDVMTESGQIALSHIRANRERFGIDAGAFARRFHVHFPAGAVPKDGPSAGVTMTTALVSLLTGRPVKPTVGMTGEVTLQGKVLPIGGVKQKLLAAHRAGLTDVVIPAANEPDLEDLPAGVLDELRVHPVAHVDEVLALVLDAGPVTIDDPVIDAAA